VNQSEIFKAAIKLATHERNQYLGQACGNDPQKRAELESLLSAHDIAESFLERPASGDARGANVTADYQPISEGPGSVIGPYRLMEQVGEGGFGLVFVAQQTEPVRRKVALKIIKPGMDTKEVIARFEAERQALALMDHPNIARVLDAGTTTSGRPYFVMELIRGIPIAEYCDDQKLSMRERLKLFVAVCRAVQHAHSKGVIHRDLKPSTTPFDGQRFSQAAYEEIKRIIREEDPPTPSRRLKTLGETLTAVSKQRSSEPARLTASVAGELDWIVMCCLEKERSRRYQTAAELGADIQRYLDDQPVQVVPPSQFYKTQKLIRRNRIPIAVAVGYVVLSIIGLAAILVQARKANDARVVALEKAAEATSVLAKLKDTLIEKALAAAFGGNRSEFEDAIEDLRQVGEFYTACEDNGLAIDIWEKLIRNHNLDFHELLDQALLCLPSMSIMHSQQ
jgi:Protein kinase domain